LVATILAEEPDQNHPLMFLGSRSARSQPSKSQRRPEVQNPGTLAPEVNFMKNPAETVS
jgi:hypothetical protein